MGETPRTTVAPRRWSFSTCFSRVMKNGYKIRAASEYGVVYWPQALKGRKVADKINDRTKKNHWNFLSRRLHLHHNNQAEC